MSTPYVLNKEYFINLSGESWSKMFDELLESSLLHMNSDNEGEFVSLAKEVPLHQCMRQQLLSLIIASVGSDKLIREFIEDNNTDPVLHATRVPDERARHVARVIGNGVSTYMRCLVGYVHDMLTYDLVTEEDELKIRNVCITLLQIIREENNLDIDGAREQP